MPLLSGPLIATICLFKKIAILFFLLKEPLKTKKFEADETEKAQFALANEHFEVEVQRRNSKFLEAPIIKNILGYLL